MVADTKIAGLFNLITESPPLQDEASCKFVIDHLVKFYMYINDNKSDHPWIAHTELDVLGSSLKLLKAEEPHERIDWMPTYGCALMKSKAGCTSGVLALNLISLDLHQFDTRSEPSSNGYNYVDNASSTGYQLLHIGTCDIDDLKTRQDSFLGKLAAAQTRTGDKRSAAGGQQGHQKTPAFIHALYREVFSMQNQSPRGGWTDVGMHTGGQETRPTAWPLVTSSLYQLMNNCETSIHLSIDKLFKKAMAYFGLYMCERKIDEYNQTVTSKPRSNAPDVLLDRAFRILQSSSVIAAAVSDEGVDQDMSQFLTLSKSIRDQITAKASSLSNLFSEQYKLPQSDTAIIGTFKNFSFNIPAKYSPAHGTLSESEIRKLTEQNIGWTRVLVCNRLEDVDEWVKKSMMSVPSQDSLLRMLVLKTVEGVIWDYAMNMPVLTPEELQILTTIVDNYREVLHSLKQSQEYKPLSLVELKSREMLVIWVAFCIIHHSAVSCNKYKIAMNEYGVPLDFNDLSHLVLSDPNEWDVALRVAEYLRKIGTDRPIFSLRDERPTFDMGRRICNASPDLVNIWEVEEKDASSRIKGHWNEVLRKKKLASELRASISDLEIRKAETNRKLTNEKEELEDHEAKLRRRNKRSASRIDINSYNASSHTICKNSVNALHNEVNSLESRLERSRSDLTNALKAPPPVFQPLPIKRENAMPILFFLHMPPIFQLLARFSFTSQQLRLPQPWTAATTGSEGTEKIDITGLVTRGDSFCQYSWKDYYNAHQQSQYHRLNCPRTGSDFSLLLRSKTNDKVPPINVGPQSIDYIYSESDGIWYPDEMKPRMAWFGGPKNYDMASSHAEINPFVELDHFIIASNFTERLENETSLQWALIQPGERHIHSSRGNLPYARQNFMPEWLSKTQYLSFANLRSYPNVQLRNILMAIQERQLPFTEHTVHILVRQALFHIGKISNADNGRPVLEWKTDLESLEFGQDAHIILESFYKEIKDSPSSYMCVKLIGMLCNFFSKWENCCRITARNLAASVFQWAEELDGEIEKSPPSLAPSIQAKQAVLFQHAILVLIGGDLEECDISLLIKMIVKSRNLFTEDFRSDEIRANATEIKYGICQKVKNILQVTTHAPTMLTSVLRSVIPRCPAVLDWHPWKSENNSCTQCFEARCDDGCFYSINVISGEVLINGLPPSRLPQSVVAHPLYIRTFGDSNFEVVEMGDFLETRYPIFGRFYRFSRGSSLTIYECQEDESEMLELLDGTPDGVSWAIDLPIRLKSMHSHWLLRESNLIVVRDVCFKDRNVSFLIQLDSNAGDCEGQVKIISKFESKKYVHSVTDDDGKKLRFVFPRYELTFAVSDGFLHCKEIAGYQLSPQQQIDGTLRGVKMYLLLEQIIGDDNIIIFPKGEVVRESPWRVQVEINDKCDEKLLWHQYRFHPRFHFIETKQSRASRMQLVALHVATSTVLPDELIGMTGEERAVTLLRESWTNSPLSDEECLVLDNIKKLARGLSPTVSLLCDNIYMSSKQLSFLHKHTGVNRGCTVAESEEGSSYLNNVKNNKISSRCHLTSREEEQVIGLRSSKPAPLRCFEPNQQLLPNPVGPDEIKYVQRRLDEIRSEGLCTSEMPIAHALSFPLDITPSSKLEQDMMDELRESWDAYMHSRSVLRTASLTLSCNNELNRIQRDVVELRRKVENFAIDALNQDQVPEQTSFHWHDKAQRILRVAGRVPTAVAADLAKIAVDPSMIASFNPMIKDKSCLLESISIWLQLCVYEDKLARLLSFSKSGFIEGVMTELAIRTVWDTSMYPCWLVFEVENGIQIRPDQYKVVQHLIDNPGDVVQLNMGLGKTRVILPMLVLHSSFQLDNSAAQLYVRNKVPRLHFLSALFEEAYKYLQNYLSASILGIKIYTIPFCRDVTLDLKSVATMKCAIDDCRLGGGALVVAPEHRLSLELKVKELHRGREHDIAARIEKDILEQDIWYDIIDECDEVLRHRYQLIYAMGVSIELPGGGNRWRAVQAILSVLTHNEDIREFLHLHPEACKLVKKSSSRWAEVQFFDGEPLEIMLKKPRFDGCIRQQVHKGLLEKVADAIICDPPHEMEWMRDHPNKMHIKRAMTKEEFSADSRYNLSDQQLSDVLVLRGFLVGGLLRHCLLKRHRVDFGVARPGKRRVAVPFRFADTPDERSEFAHPDCAIAFTVLSYYHDGLTRLELDLTLKTLLTLGDSAQHNFYGLWFKASCSDQSAVDHALFELIDCIEKIDLTNQVQFEKLCHIYSHNMYTINFYLNYCVLPYETEQFESRLTGTAWNLAQNKSKRIVGFSGTNDNHRLLPLQVRQYFASKDKVLDPILNNLDGTNGKMIDMMLEHTVAVRQLGTEAPNSDLLINLITEGITGSSQIMHALIDCGALLAGTDLLNFSKRILVLLPMDEFGGVLFFDGARSHEWIILERTGRLLQKDISPVEESKTFAIFDEPRCRGTDLKLRSDAIALLTLAPKLCKDKLMQAAGRLRKLGCDQKLVIAGGSDVFSKIKDLQRNVNNSNNDFVVTVLQVLSWTMKNTVEATSAGLSNWANQGLFFSSTYGKDPTLCITEEVLNLKDMYGKSFMEETVSKLTNDARQYHMNRTGGEEALDSSLKKMVALILKQVDEYGLDFTNSTRGCDEECERELELEIEEEEEVEVEVPLMTPMSEKIWDYTTAFTCQTPIQLSPLVGVKLLSEFIAKFLEPVALAEINWSKKIYCTNNFAHTIVHQRGSALNSFLRVVNFLLFFPDGSFLLLSEFEGNSLLKLFWDYSDQGIKLHHMFLHSSLLRKALDGMSEIALRRSLPLDKYKYRQASDVISEESMATIQLFGGETTYVTKERKEALRTILRVPKDGTKFCPRAETERLVEMRGLAKLYPYSDLEAVCEKLLCEILSGKDGQD